MSGDYESLYLVTDLQQDTLTVLMLLSAADRQVFKMPTLHSFNAAPRRLWNIN
jgi:hypothetical protein